MQWYADEEPSWFIHGVLSFLCYNSFISESSCPPTHFLLDIDVVLLFLRKPSALHVKPLSIASSNLHLR